MPLSRFVRRVELSEKKRFSSRWKGSGLHVRKYTESKLVLNPLVQKWAASITSNYCAYWWREYHPIGLLFCSFKNLSITFVFYPKYPQPPKYSRRGRVYRSFFEQEFESMCRQFQVEFIGKCLTQKGTALPNQIQKSNADHIAFHPKHSSFLEMTRP